MELRITRHTGDDPNAAYYTVASPNGRTLYQTPDPIDAALWAAAVDPDRIEIRWDPYIVICDPDIVVPAVAVLVEVTELA